tara:strand:+ start:847 stop:1125 length:279 start_codon:yes stop_codon:yes gene_type:complete
MADIGNCTGKCLNHKGIGSKMDWKISSYCNLCRKVFSKEEIINSKFCPCCKGWMRRGMRNKKFNKLRKWKTQKAKIKMNESKQKTRLSKVSQ